MRDGDTAAGGFGGAGPETSFQIGSVTKVFTALANSAGPPPSPLDQAVLSAFGS